MDSTISLQKNDKAIRLLDYLTKLASLRSTLIRDIGEYEQVLWLSSVPHQRECFTRVWGKDDEREPDEWLEVANRREPGLPKPPDVCKDWAVLSVLRNTSDLPKLLPEITRQVDNPDWQEGSDQLKTNPIVEHLQDHPEVREAWEQYVEAKWIPWTDEHNAWEEVHRVYSSLFAIHQEQLRLGEEYELVLGIGLLTWQTPTGQRVRRHLIVADAILEFEARLGKFTVRPHAEGAKLRAELDMLDIEEQPARAEEAAKCLLGKADDDPWEKGCIEGVLQSLVHSIDAQGQYEDCVDSNARASTQPVVEYAPALILRKRSARGLGEVLKRIKKRIEEGEPISGEFADLSEMRRPNDREVKDRPAEAREEFCGEVYFPKPSNEEQLRIVDKLRTSNGVLVQGPPGTGKSHTIANLICHLLATGQRTLITAKTPRALQVLEGLIPPEVRALCINLLGSGLQEQRSLESSVGGILRKNEEWNENRASHERVELEGRLRALREEKARANRRLRDIRESETHTQSVADGAYRGTAARIAEAVNRNRDAYGWFADNIPLENPCVLSADDLYRTLAGLRHFTPEKRKELDLAWGVEDLPSPEQFLSLVVNERKAVEEEQRAVSGAKEQITDLLLASEFSTIERIHDVFSKLREIRQRLLALSHPWIRDALRDIVGGQSAVWRELLRVTRDVTSSVEGHVAVADDTQIDFPDPTDIKVLYADALTLKGHTEAGRTLGWSVFRPHIVRERAYVIKSVKISGRTCSTGGDFSILADSLHVRIECEKAWSVWAGRADKMSGPYALQVATLKSMQGAIENALSLEDIIQEGREAIRQCPNMVEPVWLDELQIADVVASSRLALARIGRQRAMESIQKCEELVSYMASQTNTHPVLKTLLHAIRSRNVEEFTSCASKLDELNADRRRLEEVDDYQATLHRTLPKLADDLMRSCGEQHWEERLQHFVDAWRWAQARYWVEEYIRQDDAPALSTRVKQIEDELNTTIAEVASLHAWSFCFSRLREEHRRHMAAWQQAMRRIGKGTGKYAPRHRREAQQHLRLCREAVPAWVMPLHRVWDTVNPEPGIFDVIIVDEASQCGLEGLPLLYLGKKVIIVGDDKQISPEEGFIEKSSVFQLMEHYLYDFEHRDSFHRDASLFDHGKLRYGTGRIILREHFRCMPEIIRFSNDLCYSDTPLIPLRQYGPNRLTPIEHVLVNGGYREGTDSRTINRPEADAIVKRIVELCNDRRYDGKTIGVVVLHGEAQAGLIESQLLERLGAEAMEHRRLVCGNPYSFQGDERDVVLLSLVAANSEEKRIVSLAKPADERRFNVAASRARDQMILFHSVTLEDLSTSCLRYRLLDFFMNTKPRAIAGIDQDELMRRAHNDNRSVIRPPVPFGSWFEVDVALEILQKGFTVIPQYEVAGKRIDLVVEGRAPLAVECDGDHWHGPDKYEEDMQRQRMLERCHWEFFRIRESVFYSNKRNTMERLWKVLEDRGMSSQASPPVVSGVDRTHEDIGDESNCIIADDGEEDDDEDVERMYLEPRETCGLHGRRVDEISAMEIQDGIVRALSKCPNQSCTLHSLATRVLKELGVITRGNPRLEFEKRVMRGLATLETRDVVERYRAKNKRVRLVCC